MTEVTWTPTDRERPAYGQRVDWITPNGVQVDGGTFFRGVWFLPEKAIYGRHAPIFWRPAATTEEV